MLYVMPDRKTVRVRTCNDHILVVVADGPGEDASLNVEGTDYVLIVMPTKERTLGPVDAYLVPTEVVVDAARTTHKQWLRKQASPNGNRTWNLWFDDKRSGVAPEWYGFARKWADYRLNGTAHTLPDSPQAMPASTKLNDKIVAWRRQIAAEVGVAPEAVRISIDFQ
jgi:hypothetical protein